MRSALWIGGLFAPLLLLACTQNAPQLQVVRPLPAPQERPQARPEAVALYVELEDNLRARGLLREVTSAQDAPFTDTMLARNFLRIALYTEFTQENGSYLAKRGTLPLRRWQAPVRLALRYGPSASPALQRSTQALLDDLLPQLAAASAHPIAQAQTAANFNVYLLAETERAAALNTMIAQGLALPPEAQNAFLHPDSQTKCLVLTTADRSGRIQSALALIRAELPKSLLRSCLHEEIAQGLGLTNDHPLVRPSLFNDDDEFAILTDHDLNLLKILYDPRLSTGMKEDEAAPIVRQIATEIRAAQPA